VEVSSLWQVSQDGDPAELSELLGRGKGLVKSAPGHQNGAKLWKWVNPVGHNCSVEEELGFWIQILVPLKPLA
jgi:hypothetical protein